MKPSYTSNEMIQFVAHFDVSKMYEIRKKQTLNCLQARNIFNCVLLYQRHLTAELLYNDFGANSLLFDIHVSCDLMQIVNIVLFFMYIFDINVHLKIFFFSNLLQDSNHFYRNFFPLFYGYNELKITQILCIDICSKHSLFSARLFRVR